MGLAGRVMGRTFFSCVLACSFGASVFAVENEGSVDADVVVDGGTPGGVMAAVAAARSGHSVSLIDMNNHLGGVVSGGLTATDMGNRMTVGGFSKEYFDRIAKYYRDKYGADSEQYKTCREGIGFEPHVAEQIFDQMVAEQPSIKVWKKNRFKSVAQKDNKITSIVVEDLATGATREFTGRMFIDSSYEGDLMAAAGVPYRYGRESRDEYGEILAGISVGSDEGKADNHVMTYNYRVSVTPLVENRVLFPKPENYDPTPWLNFGARIKRENLKDFGEILLNSEGRMGPNRKIDLNWGDLAGLNEGYVDGDWKTRDDVAAKYRDHFLSGLWYFQNDPDLPEEFRKNAQNWGLPKDEFPDTGHFPFQLYVREARRMVGAYVLTEKDLAQNRYKPNGVCSGSYGVDCHAVQILTIGKKRVVDYTTHTFVPSYDIPYGCLIPKDKPENLLVPVCPSVSHVAFCSMRMEPVFMMLGQAAGDAAALAIDEKTSVQGVNVPKLRDVLRKQGAILDFNFQPQIQITWTPERPQPGEPVKFSVKTGEMRDPIKQVWWDFTGDGTVGSGQNDPTFTFSDDKVHEVSLLMEDAAGRRQLATASIPVGKADIADVTVDDRSGEFFGKWDGTYSKLDRQTMAPDVFLGLGIQYLQAPPRSSEPLIARFATTLPRGGRYELCLGFRPARHQAKTLAMVVHTAEGPKELTVSERENKSPFYWMPVGEFAFEAGKGVTVEFPNRDTQGQVVIDGLRFVYRGR